MVMQVSELREEAILLDEVFLEFLGEELLIFSDSLYYVTLEICVTNTLKSLLFYNRLNLRKKAGVAKPIAVRKTVSRNLRVLIL